jgi:hypothetical protein
MGLYATNFTLATVEIFWFQVRISMKSLGAVASIAWSIERVHTLTIFADAREIGLLSCYLAGLVSDGPIHEQRSLPMVMIIER